MATLLIVVAAAVLVLGLAGSSIHAIDIRLEHHLEHFTGVRNPAAFDTTPWSGARSYIFSRFQSYNLITSFQDFNTDVADETFTGKNVIGIAEGPANGAVYVVGADFDTALLQPSPMEDNGAGIAALLEVAKNYMEDVYISQNYFINSTVIFVAFDINTVEYGESNAGRPGSYFFLYQWLWPYLQASSKKFHGAIILDSISKYNTESQSQFLPDGFENMFPEAYEDITRGGNKGNFLSLITRKSKLGNPLSTALLNNYNNDQRARMFRLLNLTVIQGVPLGDTFSMFNHQSHLPFWTFETDNKIMPLPAILLTDTDMFRKPGTECASSCTADKFLTRSKNAFITKTTEALTQTLADLQIKRSGTDNSGVGMMPSYFTVMTVIIIGKIFH